MRADNTVPAAGAGTGIVEGTVYNSASGTPVARARVTIKGTQRETLTDDNGGFYFADLPAGAATLEVSYLGFDSQTSTVPVTAGKSTTFEFKIRREGSSVKRGAGDDDVVELDRFTVVADQMMSAQAIAMNEQRHAASITNVIALDELPGQGSENIGDYIRFLPGVAIMDDGENPGTLALGGSPRTSRTSPLMVAA
ncbi:carboxypeptidase-like regulatory domain-containing protein [Ereboglobus luteus]|nr:carboxypeptidase-like regulatory domain-containing protein [Ereboglobus luteus]